MKEKNANLSETNYLGRKAFLLFLVKRMKLAALLLFLSLGLPVVAWCVPQEYQSLAERSAEVSLLLFFVVFCVRVVETFVEYRGYSYKFDEEFFQVNYGYVVKNEIAIVYHHIQNAIVKRDLFDRMVGVSKLVVVMDGSKDADEQDIVLPAIDKDLAKVVQKELMRQARIHSVNVGVKNGGARNEEEYEYLGSEEI